MHRILIVAAIAIAALVGCGPGLPATAPDEAPSWTEEAARGPDASFAEALAISSDALAVAHTTIAIANRAAVAEALRAAGPGAREREAAVLAVYTRFFPIWKVYAAGRESYVAAAKLADARDEASRGRRLAALVALAEAGDRLAAAVAEARGAAFQPDGAR